MNGRPRTRLRLAALATAALTATGLALVPAISASAQSTGHDGLPVPPGAIKHIIVVQLENESFRAPFGPPSPPSHLHNPPAPPHPPPNISLPPPPPPPSPPL